MSLWSFRKKAQEPADTGRVQKSKKTVKRSPPVAMEVKVLAIEALEAGLSAEEAGELAGVGSGTVQKWRNQCAEGGMEALARKASSIGVRNQCSVLEERIVAERKAHPEHGVRRIRDDLRRAEGLEVSAEKVRATVNEAGLGNPPPQARRRAPRERRFERVLPNALWQIDIFTFQLKRMYPVYLVGIIDDHSRYITGWGLFRQQNADAVLEVTKGAIGQWGAPREILSDNGRQFVAWRGRTRFQKVLKQQGIGHVRSAPHHPMTLGKIERFWKTLWQEFLSEAVFASFADACQRIEHWIHYYNHQRPHQGIDGACPADRFYGMSEDVEEALKQGCEQNALRLALGQEPQPPLYLLGQLGGTDVRVVRKGEAIEVKVGDAVHEVIHMGAPFTIGEDGSFGRVEESVEVEGTEWSGTLPRGDAGAPGRGDGRRAVPELRGEPADVVSGDGGGGPSRDGSVGAEAARSQADAGVGSSGEGTDGIKCQLKERTGPLEDQVRGGQDVHRTRAATGPADESLGWQPRKKTPAPEEEDGLSRYDEASYPGGRSEGGRER
jgi:transposase InsO family protein